MSRGRRRRIAVLLSLVLLIGSVAYADESNTPLIPPLTEAELASYGNRAGFFKNLPPSHRPDVDWRTALSPSLADAWPQWSQGFEELIIRDFFADRKGGFFVDVGCYKPKGGSTTYDLESRLGWTGIGIDAMEHFRTPWKRFRPGSTFVHAAVSDKDGEILDLFVAYNIVSLESQVIEEWGLADKAKTVEVETSTLDSILAKQGVEKIDFMSIDIEGAEMAALRGLDLKRYRPAFIGIETATPDAVIAVLDANGYEVIEKYRKIDKINLYFRPKPAK